VRIQATALAAASRGHAVPRRRTLDQPQPATRAHRRGGGEQADEFGWAIGYPAFVLAVACRLKSITVPPAAPAKVKMGWEWRVFYAGNIESAFLAHAAKALPLEEPEAGSSKSDARFDVYVSVTEDTGVKVRGDLSSAEIEVKERQERTGKGLEQWKKVRGRLRGAGSGRCAARDGCAVCGRKSRCARRPGGPRTRRRC
jgi:hypothetical protein